MLSLTSARVENTTDNTNKLDLLGFHQAPGLDGTPALPPNFFLWNLLGPLLIQGQLTIETGDG